MAAVTITIEQQAVLQKVYSDSHDVLYSGVNVPSGTYLPPTASYVSAVNSPPVVGTPPAPMDVATVTKEGSRLAAAAIVNNVVPMAANGFIVPSLAVSTSAPTGLISTVITVPCSRKCIVIFNGTAYSSVAATGMTYALYLNGAQQPNVPNFYFNDADTHLSFMHTWVVTVPSGANTLLINVWRSSGTGVILTDANDVANISVLG